MIFLFAALTAFVYVFLLAFQQLNVVHNHYWRIPLASIFMGIGDVVLIMWVVKADTVWMGVTNGIGGALGCYLAMFVNRRWKKK